MTGTHVFMRVDLIIRAKRLVSWDDMLFYRELFPEMSLITEDDV